MYISSISTASKHSSDKGYLSDPSSVRRGFFPSFDMIYCVLYYLSYAGTQRSCIPVG